MSKVDSQFLQWFGSNAPVLLKKDPRVLDRNELFKMILHEHPEEGTLAISKIMEACNQDIRLLNNLSIENFKSLGLSFKQVDRLLAALELINRGFEQTSEDQTICSSSDAFQFMRSRLCGLRLRNFGS